MCSDKTYASPLQYHFLFISIFFFFFLAIFQYPYQSFDVPHTDGNGPFTLLRLHIISLDSKYLSVKHIKVCNISLFATFYIFRNLQFSVIQHGPPVHSG